MATKKTAPVKKAKWQGMNWIRQEKRLAIYIRDGFTCAYCHKDLRDAKPKDISLDHLIPRCADGSNDASNLVTCCSRCNSSRAHTDYTKYLDKVWGELAAIEVAARIIHTTAQPLNITLAKAILAGKTGHPAEELR